MMTRRCRAITLTYNNFKYWHHMISYRIILGKMLPNLSKNEYIVQRTKDFISFIRPQKVLSNDQLTSFDVISLFTNLPVDGNIYMII